MVNKRILKKIIFIGIFAIPFIPIIFFNDLALPLITGKNFVFRVIIEVLFGVWLLLAIYDKKYRPKLSLISGAIVTFLVVMAIANFLGADPYKSFWGDFQRMEGFITLLHLFVYFLIASTVLNTEKLWNSFFNKSIGASVALSVIALFQLAGLVGINTTEGRLDSTMGNATYFALYLLLHIFLSMFMLARHRGLKGRYLYGGIVLLELFVLYFTATRSAILGLIVGIFIATILIYLFEHEHKTLKKVSIGLVLGMVFLVGGFIAMKNQPLIRNNFILNRFSGISFKEIRNQSRYYLWSISAQGFKDNPVLGQGQENFNLIFNKYYNPSLHNDEVVFSRAHNVLFEWLIAGGILGFLSYISLYFAILYSLWFLKRNHWPIVQKSILTGLISAYLINNLFLFDNITSYIVFFSLLAYIHSQTLTISQEPLVKKNDMPKIKVSVVALVSLSVIFLVYSINAKAITASYYYKKGTDLISNNKEESYEAFNKSLSLNSFGNSEIRKEIAVSVSYPNRFSATGQELKSKFFDFAILEMQKELELSPDDANNYYLIGSVLYSYGQYEDAVRVLEKASLLAPNKQIILLKLVV